MKERIRMWWANDVVRQGAWFFFLLLLLFFIFFPHFKKIKIELGNGLVWSEPIAKNLQPRSTVEVST